ncbi:MAG: hypothetical protein HZY76_05130 [Anaerolineae bacterium]|nr:MAG: hypothetical protein HZY76_05130 [Anaerolineae bacterium]
MNEEQLNLDPAAVGLRDGPPVILNLQPSPPIVAQGSAAGGAGVFVGGTARARRGGGRRRRRFGRRWRNRSIGGGGVSVGASMGAGDGVSVGRGSGVFVGDSGVAVAGGLTVLVGVGVTVGAARPQALKVTSASSSSAAQIQDRIRSSSLGRAGGPSVV